MKKIQKRDQEYIKQKNKNMVLDIIKNKRPISRADIVKMTDMSPTSVSRIVTSLIEQGLVKETELQSTGVGRKAILLDIDLESVLTIGVYINRYIIKVGILNFGGEILFEKHITFNSKGKTPETTIHKVCDFTKKVINETNIDISKIIGIGVSLPGIINFNHGEVVISAPLRWRNVNISRQIEKELNIRTVVDNDAKLTALAESLCGAAKNSKITALISLGTGVGSALIINGEIFRGATNIAGEIGHITLEPNGMLCDCGRRGCLQTFIVEERLMLEANKIKEIKNIKEIFDAANNEEDWAINILDYVVTYICTAINNMVCMYNPDTLILSGSLIEVHPEIVEYIEKKCDVLIWEPLRNTFKIVYSQLKSRAEIIGAATLALNTYFNLD